MFVGSLFLKFAPDVLWFAGLRGGRGFVVKLFEGNGGAPAYVLLRVVQEFPEGGDRAWVAKFSEGLRGAVANRAGTVGQK